MIIESTCWQIEGGKSSIALKIVVLVVYTLQERRVVNLVRQYDSNSSAGSRFQ